MSVPPPSGSAVTGELVQQYELGERPAVASFEATLLDGSTLSSSSLRGTVTVMNVWGSWCGPCRAEAPDLVDAAQRLGDRAQFYGINVRDSPDAARAFERRLRDPLSQHPSRRQRENHSGVRWRADRSCGAEHGRDRR